VNRLTLAVAGGRKTSSIIDACCQAGTEDRILVLTFTQANQRELSDRLAARGPHQARVDVQGWFSFLLSHWVRPYLPRLFAGQRLRGLNFEGDPGYVKGLTRFLDAEQRAYRRHLARLAHEVNAATTGAAIDRLSRLYDAIYIDEVQDLGGWDLDLLEVLIVSTIELNLVGDARQAVLSTNVRDQKNPQYRGIKIVDWFRKQEQAGRLQITHQNATWRSSQEIATLADGVIDPALGFPATQSHAPAFAGHSGIFTVRIADAERYAETHDALCLRSQSNLGNECALPYATFGDAKGMEASHVLIWPTAPIAKHLVDRTPLAPKSACGLYVAITRARASVAFITDRDLGLPVWTAGDESAQD
jgi:DNA helicase-2/ATP-dependent DNA helicase PcrA